MQLVYCTYVKHPKYLTVIATCLLFVGAGCFRKPVQPTVLPEQPDRGSENMAGDFSVTPVEIKKEFSLNDYGACKITLSYPQLQAEDWSVATKAQFDQQLASFIAQALDSTAAIQNPAELEQLADKYLSDCQTEITREYNELTTADDQLYTNLKRNIELVYSVELNTAPRLTIGLAEYSYTGGAHPNQQQLFFNLDHDLDKLLTLGDVIAPDKLLAFEQYEKAQLLADNRSNLYPENAAAYDTLIETVSTPTPENQLATYGSQTNFYLTPTSLITYYNAYDIAPYAAGPITVELPLENLREFLK